MINIILTFPSHKRLISEHEYKVTFFKPYINNYFVLDYSFFFLNTPIRGTTSHKDTHITKSTNTKYSRAIKISHNLLKTDSKIPRNISACSFSNNKVGLNLID